MKIHVINTGNFKLDGGAMFGVVPKSIYGQRQIHQMKITCVHGQ